MLRVSETRRYIQGREGGFTLVEVLVAVVIVTIGLVGMAQFFISAGGRVMDSETRALLHQIAAQEIEEIRALPYEDIGTENGNPRGWLPDFEQKTVEGVPVEVTREVVFATDPSYTGPFPANYRRVTVVVRAADSDRLDPMQLSTIVAGGAEGGALDITVTDVAGRPVPNARVKITNDNLTPRVNIDSSAIRTNQFGRILVPGLRPDNTNGYYVVAGRSGYNDAATPSGLVVQRGTPFTVVQLIVDELSSLNLRLTDGNGAPVGGVSLTVTGHLSVEPWVFSEQIVTDGDGRATLTDLRYATSRQPIIVQTTGVFVPALRLPPGTDPDPIDGSITLSPGHIGLIIEPGTARSVDLELPLP